MPEEPQVIHLIQQDKTFIDQVVYLSGQAFLDCHFVRCTFVLLDRICPQFSNCQMEACLWHLDILVSDYQFWERFLHGMAPLIHQSLPRPLGHDREPKQGPAG